MHSFGAIDPLHWQHLQAEFARIDLLLRREVRRWVLAGQDPNDDYRGLYITQAEAQTLLDRPLGVSWGQLLELPPEEESLFAQARQQVAQQAEALRQQMVAQGQTPCLQQLADAFGLDRTALDILLLCLAPAFDTRYERIYGYLQDNVTRRRPAVRLVLDLLGEPGLAQMQLAPYLSPEAPLFRHNLLEYVVEAPPANAHWINQTLHPDETVVAWLRGGYEPGAVLGRGVILQRGPEGTPIATDLSLRCGTHRDNSLLPGYSLDPAGMNHPPIWFFYGIDSEEQAITAQQFAAQANKALLTVYLNKIINDNCPPLQVVRLALRDARLTGAIPFLRGWDVCLNSDGVVEPALITALDEHPGPVLVAGQNRWQPGGVARRRPIFHWEFGMPTYQQRLALWEEELKKQVEPQIAPIATDLKSRGVPLMAHSARFAITQSPTHLVTLSGQALSDLAAQFVLTRGQIHDAAASARDRAQQAGRAVQAEDLFAAARSHSNPRLSALARKITPRYTWDDLVLPLDEKAKLTELVATVRHRPKMLESWGVGQKLATNSGVMALFAGPPGTGKTMGAEVVAHELQLDLYKIDLASIVSKYIGETEKNLERIFTEASNSNSILFFDEADAIFGKRSEVKDAHDRYANIEVSYLLQRMELYEGITILATNLRANLDEAFARRFFRTVEFPFPKREERLRIWQTLFPPHVPTAVGQPEFDLLARRFEVAGGNIRNIIYSATVLAADDGEVVTMAHLLHGARREMQKMGRLVNEEDFV